MINNRSKITEGFTACDYPSLLWWLMSDCCSEPRCTCDRFEPNIFQKNICKECYHVLSKHRPLREEKVEPKRLSISCFLEQKDNLPSSPPKIKDYPSTIRTISEQFQLLSDTNSKPSSQEPPRTVPSIVDISATEKGNYKQSISIQEVNPDEQGSKEEIDLSPQEKRETDVKNQPKGTLTRIGVVRSATDVIQPSARRNPGKGTMEQTVRQSTTLLMNFHQKEVQEVKAPPPAMLPPVPASLPRLPAVSKRNHGVTYPTIVSPSARSELKTNTKRHAIRHRATPSYNTMFIRNAIDSSDSDSNDSQEDIHLRKLASTLRKDPRKPRQRSSTFSREQLNMLKASNTIPITGKEQSNIKRRSSLPLQCKLAGMGITIPPVSLNIALHEPSKEVRTIEVKIQEAQETTVAVLLHSLSQELTTMQDSLETPKNTESPVIGQKNQDIKKKNLLWRVGQFPFRKKKEESESPSVRSPPQSPKTRLARIKDFALYYPDKDEWLEPEREISSYCFPDGTLLQYKRKVRNFKLRMQYEIKLFFPHSGWAKTIVTSPSATTVAKVRADVIQWLKEENLWDELPIDQMDETLSQYGIYLNDEQLKDESKVLSTYDIKQKDTLHIKTNPGYTLQICSSQQGTSGFLLHLQIDSTFQDLVEKIQKEEECNDCLEVKLAPPLGRLDQLSIGLSRALLKTGEQFQISSPTKEWIVAIKKVPKDSQKVMENRIPYHVLIQGEKIIPGTIIEHVSILQSIRGQKEIVKYSGSLMITNYRILLETKFKETNNWIEIPLTSVSRIEKQKSKSKEHRKYFVDIFCKCVRKLSVGFVDNEHRNHGYRVLVDAISRHSQLDLFAFYYEIQFGSESSIQPGWDMYDAKAEFARMGIFLFNEERFGWRLTNVNANYEICKSYPALLVVPATVSDDLIRSASKFRTKSRLPALVWLHPVTGVSLCRDGRSSQPKVGLQRNTSKDDQSFLSEISVQGTMNQEESGVKRQLHVFDARPMKAAVGNTVMGAGYESDTTGYGFCHSHFLNIDNIHAVRESFNKLQDLCISSVEEDTNTYSHWLQELESTNWFYLLSRILVGAKRIAELLVNEYQLSPVLIHCSDGWDRTSQLSALSQLLVDPYYRTFKGFQILICKEWLSFGHQFAFRMGHNYGGKEEAEQQAPIFLQFLDCVHQLTIQFPTKFEINETLLGFLHDELLHCRFGTFLMNCEREREAERLSRRTQSVWNYIDNHKDDFVNPFYEKTSQAVDYIAPNCEIPNLHLWDSYYFMHLDTNPTPKVEMERRMKELQAQILLLQNQIAASN